MLQDDEYDSDTSDEDFVPEGAESEEEPVSEEEDLEHEDNEGENPTGKVKKKNSTKKKKKNPLLVDIEETKQNLLADADDSEKAVENEEKTKKKAENLWADFLADVEDKPTPPPKPKASSWASLLGNKKTSNSSSTVSAKAPAVTSKTQNKDVTVSTSSTVKITKVFEFAGEEVRVEKEVDVNSDEAKLALADSKSDEPEEGAKGVKRPSGLSSIMGLLDSKKQKLTTLEKTKLDWNSFKSSEGIDEELESHKKSKHGYLDKQAFLERADARQFEIERTMRMNKKSNR